MTQIATAEQTTLVIPVGEWEAVFPGLGHDIAEVQAFFAADFRDAIGIGPNPIYHPEDTISGLGADWSFFQFNIADVIGIGALAAPLLVKYGKRIGSWLVSVKKRIQASSIEDEVDAAKMRPMVGAPIAVLLAAAQAVDEKAEQAACLTAWESRSLIPGMIGEGFFHAQQKYLVVGVGEYCAFVAVYDAYGDAEMTHWA